VHALKFIQHGKFSSPRKYTLIVVSLPRNTLIHMIFSACPEPIGVYRRVPESLNSAQIFSVRGVDYGLKLILVIQ